MNWSVINKLRRFFRISIFKTIYVNFSKLPFHQAVKLPILITRGTYLYDLSGKINIASNVIKPFMIRFGYFGEDTKVWKSNKTLLKIRGDLFFRGGSHYGIGVILRVEPNAILEIGDNVRIGNETKIICYNKIVIGNNCRIAWENQIIDTTFHYIKDINTGNVLEKDGTILIGNNNWIGNRSSIMKGTITPDFCIVASNSLCNTLYEIPYSLLAGVPAKLKKTGIYRVLDKEESEIEKVLKSKLL